MSFSGVNGSPAVHSSPRINYSFLQQQTGQSQALPHHHSDVLIIGCGVAGSSAAITLSKMGYSVNVLSAAENPLECNSYWAQGGIIYKSKDDTPQLLASDVHRAGIISHDPAVMKLGEAGPAAVEEILLKDANVPFQRTKSGELDLTLEASHNRARIIYKADHTGKAITESLIETICKDKNIKVLTGRHAVEFALNRRGECVGAYVMNNDTLELLTANATVLATGGLGDLYLHTSNPEGVRGVGVAMAHRIGVKVSNMEYVQFHPTTLYIKGEKRFLLTEALRGEGAKLRDSKGRMFAKDYHPLGELAARDIVARMILHEMAKEKEEGISNGENMYLDISHEDPEWIKNRFPTIYEHCMKYGVDMTKGPVPVVPAAHYHCGGVEVDLNGRTNVPNLYAAGEVSCTGLHGANRLASTSLLEGLVWGKSAALDIESSNMKAGPINVSDVLPFAINNSTLAVESVKINDLWKQLQTIMWDSFGPIRTQSGMAQGLENLRSLRHEVEILFEKTQPTSETCNLRNGVHTSMLIAKSAVTNPKSCGTHYIAAEEMLSSSDYSSSDEEHMSPTM